MCPGGFPSDCGAAGLRWDHQILAVRMSCSLNSLKGGYMGDYIGDYYRVY